MSNVQLIIDALEKLARLGNEPHYGNSHGNTIAQDVLDKYYRLEKQKCVVDGGAGGYCGKCEQTVTEPCSSVDCETPDSIKPKEVSQPNTCVSFIQNQVIDGDTFNGLSSDAQDWVMGACENYDNANKPDVNQPVEPAYYNWYHHDLTEHFTNFEPSRMQAFGTVTPLYLSPPDYEALVVERDTLKTAIFTVCEGFNVSGDVRKILETAMWSKK